jgi:hypothetical protein
MNFDYKEVVRANRMEQNIFYCLEILSLFLTERICVNTNDARFGIRLYLDDVENT